MCVSVCARACVRCAERQSGKALPLSNVRALQIVARFLSLRHPALPPPCLSAPSPLSALPPTLLSFLFLPHCRGLRDTHVHTLRQLRRRGCSGRPPSPLRNTHIHPPTYTQSELNAFPSVICLVCHMHIWSMQSKLTFMTGGARGGPTRYNTEKWGPGDH